MPKTITASFTQRRDAEKAVEHLVQEHGIDRGAVQITAASAANTAGAEVARGDVEGNHETTNTDGGPALEGKIRVSAEVDAAQTEAVVTSFETYSGELSS